MNRRELVLVVGVSVTSSLATLGLVMAFWGGNTALAKDNPTPQKEVRAQSFILVDKDGKTRALLGMGDDGPRLAFNDKNGTVRAKLSMRENGDTRLAFLDKDDVIHTNLSLLADGRTGLFLTAKDRKAQASLDVSEGAPGLALTDNEGKISATLFTWPDGGPELLLSDKKGKHRAALKVSADGEPSLMLSDENRDRAVLGHTALEAMSTGTVEKRSASSLLLFDKEGKVIWKAP